MSRFGIFLKMHRAQFCQQIRLTEPIIEPVVSSVVPAPLPTLPTPTFHVRGTVVKYYEGPQTDPDEAMLPMPPHNMAKSPAELWELVDRKLGIQNIVQKALSFFKQRI